MKHLLKKNSLTIRGAGGGGGGAPAPPGPVAVQMYPAVLAPPLMGETSYISSFSYAEIVDLISDGPIEGLVNQDNKKVYGQDIFEGIFLNGVPVKETSRINTEELDISFLRKEIKDFWKINEGDGSQFLSKKNPYTKVITSTSSSLINNPFFSGPITITSYHPEDSLFQLINSLNLNLDSIKLAERAFDIISINNERPFLTVINIPTFTIPIADFKFDKSFFGLTDKTYGLDLEISNIGQYIYFTVDSENLNSNHYSEIPRTFIKYNGYSQPTTLKNNVPPLIGYSAQKFDNINIYIWSVYDEENGIKNISKALDRYFNKITVRQRLPGQYNYNLIKSEFKNGAEVQYPLQNFKNVEIDIQHDKELIGPFKIKNNQRVTSAKSCSAGGVRRLTDLRSVEDGLPATSNLENETSDDVRYLSNWPIEYDSVGCPLIIQGINFNYAVFDNNSKNRVEQPAIPVVHYVDNNNVEEVYVSLTLNNLSDTNHIDLVSLGFGTKPKYTETPYEGTLTYTQLINQNQITNPPKKVSERYIVGVNIYYFTPFSKIFPLGIRKNDNIDEAQYPFVKKFANEISINAIQNNNTSYPEKIILFGINLDFLQNKNFITSGTTITIENLNTLLGKYYLFKNSDFQTLLSNFDGGKLIGYSKIVNPTQPYEEFTLSQAKTTFPYNETNVSNIFTSSQATTFGNGIYLNSIFKQASTYDYVFRYELTPREVNTNLASLPCRSVSDLSCSLYNRAQQITAGTKLPAVVSVQIDTGYETNECSNYVGLNDFFSYKFDIYGLANDPSKIDLGRRGYNFVRGQRCLTNTRAGVYAVTKADSSINFHLIKVTESGQTPNYYISNSRSIQYKCIDFSCLNTGVFVFQNCNPPATGRIPVYFDGHDGIESETSPYFSGFTTGFIAVENSNSVCEICTLNENGMFGIQTSGYLSALEFEKEILYDGGKITSEIFKNSIFEEYKLNMSTAFAELQKLSYLNLASTSYPFNFIECSFSSDPSINCFGIDTYKFNAPDTNTCVQICSFSIDIYNAFAQNNNVTNPVSSYNFSIFRVNGDIQNVQTVLNNLNYKYVVLQIAPYNNYILVNLPSPTVDINTTIVSKVGLSKSTAGFVDKVYLRATNGYGQLKWWEMKAGFMQALETEVKNHYARFQNWKLDNTIDRLIIKYAIGNLNDPNDNPAGFSQLRLCNTTLYGPYSDVRVKPVFLCEKQQPNSFYNAQYNNFIYSHNVTSTTSADNKTFASKNTSSNLCSFSSSSENYVATNFTEEAASLVPSLSIPNLKSFLLSLTEDQNVPDLDTVIDKFRSINWVARSNSVSTLNTQSNNFCYFTIVDYEALRTNRTYTYKDHFSIYNFTIDQVYSSDRSIIQELSNQRTHNVSNLKIYYNYILNFELGASKLFTVPVVPRNTMASPVKTDAISVTAKFWLLENVSTDMIYMVFTDFTKAKNWKELEDDQAISYLPITKLLSVYEKTFTYEMLSRGRQYYGPTNYSLNDFTIRRDYSNPYSYQNIANIQTYDASDGWPSNFNMIYNYFYNGMNHFLVGQVVPQGILRRMRGWIRYGGGFDPSGGRIDKDYYNYNFKTNAILPSETDSSKNIRIIGAKRNKTSSLAQNIETLLKNTNFLGSNAIPRDARIHGRGDVKPSFSLTWSHKNDYYNNNSQTLNIKYVEIPITNFSIGDKAIYADDAGEQILLPPPKLDLSGSPIRRYVKITKLSYETLSPLISKRISVGTVTEIIPQTFSYPFSAIVGTKIDARSFAQMPSRSFHCKLKKVLVPSNYYPNNPSDESDIRYDVTQVGLHKIYDGDWDGTFKLMWTDNPAWILMDMLVNKRYGLGNHIAPEQIDIWELYQVARWCDGVDDEGYYYGVPDSYGGVEPRHAFNALIGDKFNVFDMINQIASVFRGHVYYMNSLITFDDDRPKPPIGEFTNADVKDGLFNYTNMKKDDEFTVVEVAFVDAKNDYRSSIEYVENADAIRKRGILKKQMNAFGVTSRGQARRIGKHFLHQTSKENLNVSFTTDMRALLYKPGDLITVHDELLNSYKNFGSVKAIEEVPNSGDLFKIVIDQALNSGIYNAGLITLYSAMKKPTYSDMQDYLIDSGNFQKLFGIDFMQPLTCNLQKLGHEMRSEDQYAFGVKNYRNGLEFCFTDVRAEEYIAMNLGCLAGPNGYLFPPFLAFEKNQQLADVNRIFGKDCLLLFTWTGSQTIMNFDYLAFGNVVNSFNANIFDENCNCHTALTPSFYSIQYIKYPCSDMEIYSSRIFNCSNFETVQFKDGNKRVRTPIKFVETGSKIKTPVCLFNNSVCFSKINDFTFSGSILFTYSGYEKIIRITGRHQLQNYTDMGMSNYLKPTFDPQEIDYISYPSSYSSIKARYSRNKNLFAPFLGEKMLDFFANLDGSIYFYDSCETLQYLNCVNRKLTPLPPFQAHCVANRIFNISGLPCLAGNNIIHFPLIQYFCVSEPKESYYLSGVVEKTGSIPVSMTYVENDTFTNEKDLQGHWSISIGTGFSDLLEFDSIANAPQKINNNIYEIINNVDCFAYFKFSGLESGNPIYLNPVKYNYNANPFSGLICTNQYLHEEAFEERSGIYSGVNTLCLFAQITGDINICHKNCGPRTAFQKLSLNNSIFSGMQRVLKSHLESGTSRYPNFNLIPSGTTESIRCSNEIAKTGSGYFLKIFDNSTRMIVDFTGIKVGNGDSFFNADGGIRRDYNFIQRNFFPYYSGKVTTGTDFRVLCKAFKVGDGMYQMQAEQKRYSALLIYQNDGFYCKHFRTFLPDSYDYLDEQCYRLFLTPYNWTGSFDRVYKTNGWLSFNCSFTEKCNGQLSYSELVENDRPSIESFSVHSYFTGFNQASGFDESPSINQYTEIYLCKTNDFGVKKNSLRHGLKNFCVGSLYSIQILNKTAPIFKIMSITENYINEYNIFATQYKEEKFLEIEENVQVDSLDNTFNALYYYQSASRLTQKNEPLKSPIILSIDYVRYSNTPALDIKWKPVSEHIVGYTQYRIYVQSPSKQTPNLQAIVCDEGYNRANDLFEYKYQGDGITNPLTNEVGNYTVSIEAFYQKDGVYVFSTPAKRSINVINY